MAAPVSFSRWLAQAIPAFGNFKQPHRLLLESLEPPLQVVHRLPSFAAGASNVFNSAATSAQSVSHSLVFLPESGEQFVQRKDQGGPGPMESGPASKTLRMP
jgi:hypothetical protein